MLEELGRLHVARELRHAPQRPAAVRTDEAMLGVTEHVSRECADGFARIGRRHLVCGYARRAPTAMPLHQSGGAIPAPGSPVPDLDASDSGTPTPSSRHLATATAPACSSGM